MATASIASTTLERFQKVLQASKHIVALCGAGLSAESEGGLWRTFDAMSLATPTSFAMNPSRVWEFYHYRRELVLKTEPNKAHKALRDFENKISSQQQKGKEGNQTFIVLTQNVDGLSSETKNLVEIHGSLFKTRCIECGDIQKNRDSPIVPALKGTEYSNLDSNIPIEKLPRCLKCKKGLLRPDVIWFEENLNEDIVKIIEFELKRCDLLLVIGTSGIVYPAAGYVTRVSSRGGKVAQFNIEKVGKADFQL
ncbi:930_t:CDS:2 [Diversispora eburnea]|uniref:930_t:CDS:1 n=1 Tax=Diversispora eburnea TaxID=1213867 RepID=A0A9N8Z8A0_9GLOM|nr:930_t:CDS:2 [Diversispora eburnea]